MKKLFITEKPSVAMEFAKYLKVNAPKKDGYIESAEYIITWCVGHLVNMSYPEEYDPNLKKWTLNTLPFIPNEYKYGIIPNVQKQFNIVKNQLLREDVDTVYVCTDSGREGEYIYRLVDMMVNVQNKAKKRVWIDSQTEDEILRGIKEAKDLSHYDSLADSAYLRAKEDYLIGINFSRVLTLLYGRKVAQKLNIDSAVIAVGRVMSCVLGMIVEREIEIRSFVKTKFYKINANFTAGDVNYTGEWKVTESSHLFNSSILYNENGFKDSLKCEEFVNSLKTFLASNKAQIATITKKNQKENAPLLFNLAEIQNECAKRFKIGPDQTLEVLQSLYEKKLVTYPRTDARVLSTAVAKEIKKNITGLSRLSDESISGYAKSILSGSVDILKSKYVNDSKITDHYAVIPTGQGFENLNGLSKIQKDIYYLVCLRFLAIFYPPAEFSKLTIETKVDKEIFYTSEKICIKKGYLEVLKGEQEEKESNLDNLAKLKKGQDLDNTELSIKEGETSPPNRYTSGTIILAMENAGKLIEDEELREQIKGSGIGTSATRAEIIKKLQRIEYIDCNEKTQVLTPASKGELIYNVIRLSIPDMLNPKLTASWEKGLEMVANNEITAQVFQGKLEEYVKTKVIANKNRD